jgi:hypothetical protein
MRKMIFPKLSSQTNKQTVIIIIIILKNKNNLKCSQKALPQSGWSLSIIIVIIIISINDKQGCLKTAICNRR